MNILLIGSGGRESALAWKIAQSPMLDKLYICPGNPGTANYGLNIEIHISDFGKIAQFVLANLIEMVVVGPEQPLVLGIKDYFASNSLLAHISVIGPDSKGAMLEGSKDFSKAFMNKYNIPTAKYKTFTKANLTEGLTFLEQATAPYVLKADGLAAGKGVIITSDLSYAKATLKDMISNLKFGEASAKVVIEEFLSGLEVSVFVVTDGKNYKILPEAKDYKRIGEADSGANTGGMGAVSPVKFADKKFMKKVEQLIIKPTINGLLKEKIDYRGFIFFGLIEVNMQPYVIEYNCRMGDPETEVVMPRLKTDLIKILSHLQNQTLKEISIEFENFCATTVMCVAGGYPEAYKKGDLITGLDQVTRVIPFHAGTKINSDNQLVTNGGRVLAMTATGNTMEEALARSNKGAETVQWKGKKYRTDIGFDLK